WPLTTASPWPLIQHPVPVGEGVAPAVPSPTLTRTSFENRTPVGPSAQGRPALAQFGLRLVSAPPESQAEDQRRQRSGARDRGGVGPVGRPRVAGEAGVGSTLPQQHLGPVVRRERNPCRLIRLVVILNGPVLVLLPGAWRPNARRRDAGGIRVRPHR